MTDYPTHCIAIFIIYNNKKPKTKNLLVYGYIIFQKYVKDGETVIKYFVSFKRMQ